MASVWWPWDRSRGLEDYEEIAALAKPHNIHTIWGNLMSWSLATLVALHCVRVSRSVSQSFDTSVASRLVSLSSANHDIKDYRWQLVLAGNGRFFFSSKVGSTRL